LLNPGFVDIAAKAEVLVQHVAHFERNEAGIFLKNLFTECGIPQIHVPIFLESWSAFADIKVYIGTDLRFPGQMIGYPSFEGG
jgi:hypothetical protein